MLPVERAKLSVLKALAVFAFSAEITRLPGHSAPRFGPVNTTAQTIPSRLTTVPQAWFPNPPFVPLPSLTAPVNAAFSLLWSGTFEQSCGFCVKAMDETMTNAIEAPAAREDISEFICDLPMRFIVRYTNMPLYRGCLARLLP